MLTFPIIVLPTFQFRTDRQFLLIPFLILGQFRHALPAHLLRAPLPALLPPWAERLHLFCNNSLFLYSWIDWFWFWLYCIYYSHSQPCGPVNSFINLTSQLVILAPKHLLGIYLLNIPLPFHSYLCAVTDPGIVALLCALFTFVGGWITHFNLFLPVPILTCCCYWLTTPYLCSVVPVGCSLELPCIGLFPVRSFVPLLLFPALLLVCITTIALFSQNTLRSFPPIPSLPLPVCSATYIPILLGLVDTFIVGDYLPPHLPTFPSFFPLLLLDSQIPSRWTLAHLPLTIQKHSASET